MLDDLYKISLPPDPFIRLLEFCSPALEDIVAESSADQLEKEFYDSFEQI